MKKVLFAVAFIAFATMSCQKERTCTCKDSDGDVILSQPIAKAKKSDQENACNVLGTSPMVTCELE